MNSPFSLILACFAGILLACGDSVSQELIAKRTLRIGEIVSVNDIGGFLEGHSDHNELLGMEVRRPLYMGQNINVNDLGPPTLIRRNDVVTVFYNTDGLGLRTVGRALGAGGEGEWIDVINTNTKLIIRGIILGRGQVEVVR